LKNFAKKHFQILMMADQKSLIIDTSLQALNNQTVGPDMTPITILLPSGQQVVTLVKNSHLPSQSTASTPMSAFPLSTRQPFNLSALKKSSPQKRRIRHKNPYLNNLACDIADHRPFTKHLLDSTSRKSLISSFDKALDNLTFDKGFRVNHQMQRFRRKLALLERREELTCRSFDVDLWMNKHFKEDIVTVDAQPVDNKYELIDKICVKSDNARENSAENQANGGVAIQKPAVSLYAKIYGESGDKNDDQVIWKDHVSQPTMKKILALIKAQGQASASVQMEPIVYTRFQTHHINQTNDLLRRHLYPGIDVSDEVGAYRNGIVAVYGKKVIGCCFSDTSPSHSTAYLMYLVVEGGWQGSGIGKQLLYFALQQNPNKDYLLHCQAINWRAMAVYSSVGFKVLFFYVIVRRRSSVLGFMISTCHGRLEQLLMSGIQVVVGMLL
jgi:ribosomal protein S18 acetylase RimI-like enzyme